MKNKIKRTENGDLSYKSTGNQLLDMLFMTAYFEKHLDEIEMLDDTDKNKLFARFIRDPRYGLGRRDLGRYLMSMTNVPDIDKIKSGRWDDILYLPGNDFHKTLQMIKEEIEKGNELAKKWMPRKNSKNAAMAKFIRKQWKMSQQEYRKFIKCESTTEHKLSFCEELNHPLVKTINFEHIPSLAMIKYFNTFLKRPDTSEKFKKYLDGVKKGEKKLNISVTTVYDIFKNRNNIDADLFFDKIEKIRINCLPILDTSGSMWDSNDSIGKAVSIAHYLAKCSTYCQDTVMSFSSKPNLIEITEEKTVKPTGYYGRQNINMWGNKTKYQRELNSMYTGDCTNTDFSKIIDVCSKMNYLPEYFIVLSDMEFDVGSNTSKNQLQKLWKEKGITTKIIWWNFNTRNQTVPEIDETGNIFLSGYSPQVLKFLEAGFDGNRYVDKLIEEYEKNMKK